jgi:multidrug efflux pump subunit AcrB
LSSTILTLIVIPAIYVVVKGRSIEAGEHAPV